jgi:RNA polymerase sigma-70 factor (ECF subfamily)
VTATVIGVEPVVTESARELDDESRDWLRSLRGPDEERREAVARLHGVLLRAARFEVARRRPDDFRGASTFTTWAYKFALLEAGVKLRKRAWQGREVPLEPEGWALFSGTGLTPEEEAEQTELVAALKQGIEEALTPHQRRVLVALALNGVPIDVLADRLGTNRNALYKTLHDARRRLRRYLEER